MNQKNIITQKNTLNYKKSNLVNKISSKAEIKEKLDDKIKTKLWIKTLLFSFRIFPKIIQTVDKIIELQASTVSFSSNVFNISRKPQNQYEQLIDMTERKKTLVNIYIMTKNIFENISEENYEFAEKKFIDKMTNEELAIEFGISLRSVYRKMNKLFDQVYFYLSKNNWSLRFIESQVRGEDWLIDRYNYYVDEYICDSRK